MLGAYPMDADASGSKKAALSISALTVFTFVCFSAISTVIFIARFISVNLEDTLYALLQIAGLTYVIYAMIVAFILRHRINRIFGQLSEIYDECNNLLEFHWELKLSFIVVLIAFR